MSQTMIKIEGVTKQYRLGAIGGTTLRDDLQRLGAKLRGKADPTLKVDAKQGKYNEKFLALDDISFEVKKGEALGIIGHNGAGKSTLLKLLSRVTAPTKGTISFNGRIASMLEVGTGFHPELTGRENVYMNGAILGMTKAEIDSKFDEIVAFAEMEKFIDTPVKRYSSGMYVKLAFAVAAHLDSEIMIMDEVLAVGDMAFQKKCLDKMSDAANNQGRTVLYVSHNMNTIRQLCTRCIVLDKGKVIFNGDTERAIGIYLGRNSNDYQPHFAVTDTMRDPFHANPEVFIQEIATASDTGCFDFGAKPSFSLKIKNAQQKPVSLLVRLILKTSDGTAITMASSPAEVLFEPGQIQTVSCSFDLENVVPGHYSVSFILYEVGDMGASKNIDVLRDLLMLTVMPTEGFNHGMTWEPKYWGHVSSGYLQNFQVTEEKPS